MKWLLIITGSAVGVYLIGVLGFHLYVQNFVERPAFETIVEDGNFSVRDYPEMVVAQVQRRGSREEAVNRGFSPLANYIFAKDRAGKDIAMTAPVTQTRVRPGDKIAMTAPVTQQKDDAGQWTVRFIMPSQYKLEDLPRPAAGVTLESIPPRRLAVVRFSGRANDALIAQNEASLRDWMKGRNLEAAGEPVFAYYNDPTTPGPLRRNEVMIPVQPSG